MIETTLSRLGLSGGAIRVYSSLVMQKEATAKRLADLSGLPRTSVYDYLSELIKMGLVVELEVNNKKVFRPDDPRNIKALLDKRIKDLEKEKREFQKALPDLAKSLGSSEPRIKFYSGREGFIVVLADIIRSQVKEALFLWPYSEMTELIGEEHLKDFTNRREQEKIKVRSIWPHFAKASRGKLHLPREKVRLAPANVIWSMGYVIYGDKVAFISSRREQFAFVVQSRDFTELQKAQFEAIWRVSKSA
ncbi:MAG TPA: helix-turn-helix domain-containing protein [Candidatus Paceibacterota bacterium]